ncbi:MAG TPA: regulatory protein GemA [Candidatus Tenderia sp.]|nr:regulatory protein GemA [Candidatus Tenderia sp.]
MNLTAKQIQLIHIGKSQLGWDRETYECLLTDIAGQPCTSSKALTIEQRSQVLDRMKAKGFKLTAKKGRAKPINAKAALVKKIQAQLISLGNLPDSYADAMAKRMFSVEMYTWLDVDDLRKIVAALTYQQNRSGADTG